jgi:hypothetical protein
MTASLKEGQKLDFYSFRDPGAAINHFLAHGPDSKDGVDITYIHTRTCFDGRILVLISKLLDGGRSIVLLGAEATDIAPIFERPGLDVFVKAEVPVPGNWYQFLKGDALAK